MRIIRLRTNGLLILEAGCAVLLFILYILFFEVTPNCRQDDTTPIQGQYNKHQFQTPDRREFHDHALGEDNNVVKTPSLDNKDGTKRPQVDSQHESDLGKNLKSTMKTTAKTDDVLSNVSFSDLLHVIEIKSLDEAAFSNWTQTFMQTRHENSFQMPPYVVNGARVCDNNTEMIIIMPADPYQGFTRELIRQTWASSIYGVDIPRMRTNSLRTKLAFVFGTRRLPEPVRETIAREASRYNDVVASDFVDSYRNLSLKMMVGLKWASKYCSSAKYVMKADLDTFVNLPLLSRFLGEISDKIPRFILGHRHTWPKHPVVRSGRWRVDKQDYPFDSFPPYLLGHSYVISGELAPLLVYASEHLPLIPTEDSLITGVLARVIRAPRLHHEGFASVFKTVISCKIVYNYEMTVTRMTPSRLISLWRDQLTNLCSNTELAEELDASERDARDQAAKGDRVKRDGQVRRNINESVVENKIKLQKWKFS